MPSTETEVNVILRFERPPPEPILRFWRTYIIGRRPYRLVGERWCDRDAAGLDFETHADPHRPGTSFSWRVIDLISGRTISPASDEEVEEALCIPSPTKGA